MPDSSAAQSLVDQRLAAFREDAVARTAVFEEGVKSFSDAAVRALCSALSDNPPSREEIRQTYFRDVAKSRETPDA